jgi:hypothetical protein
MMINLQGLNIPQQHINLDNISIVYFVRKYGPESRDRNLSYFMKV